MKVNIDDTSQLLSHVLLQNEDVATAVTETPEWVENGEIIAEVSFNGVRVDAQTMEEVLKHFIDCISQEYNADNFDNKVDKQARRILQEKIDNLDLLQMKLTEVLDSYRDY